MFDTTINFVLYAKALPMTITAPPAPPFPTMPFPLVLYQQRKCLLTHTHIHSRSALILTLAPTSPSIRVLVHVAVLC